MYIFIYIATFKGKDAMNLRETKSVQERAWKEEREREK